MLTELYIENFAIIEKQSVNFGPGLNVLSGETGAGKSVVLQALQLILGGRPSSQYIRKGTTGWKVEAHFDLSAIPKSIKEALPDICQEAELVVSRSMNESGKGRVLINGSLATVTMLEEVTSKLLSICGQNQQSLLLSPEYHRSLLDDFASNEKLLSEYQKCFDRWKDLKNRVDEVERKQAQSALRRAELNFILEELESIKLYPSVRKDLEEAVNSVGKTEEALQSGNQILERIQSVDGLAAELQVVRKSLGRLSSLMEIPGSLSQLLDSADSQIAEFERGLSRSLSKLEIDEADLDQKREDLAEIARLERKYKMDSEGLCKLLASARDEVALLTDEQAIDKLKAELESIELELSGLGEKLSKKRLEAAKRLGKLVADELEELNMQGVQFKLAREKVDFNKFGLDSLEFLIATNPGEDPKPLRMIASGGELSRITLVLKKILRDRTGVNILVFDEVDTGISGGVARAVGSKLKALAEHSQVLCITHLAQVASLCDLHILVQKQKGNRAVTVLKALSEDERLEEIARMLAGYEVTEASRESARELLSS